MAELLPAHPPKKRAAQHEVDAFIEKYDLYTDLYGDPVEVVFKAMATTEDEDTRLRAADLLMSYRYPRIKAIQGQQGQNGPQFSFNINLGGGEQPAQLPAIEVTPLPAPAADLSGILADE